MYSFILKKPLAPVLLHPAVHLRPAVGTRKLLTGSHRAAEAGSHAKGASDINTKSEAFY